MIRTKLPQQSSQIMQYLHIVWYGWWCYGEGDKMKNVTTSYGS